MSTEKTIKIIETEKNCVLRNIKGCDRKCNVCDLCLVDEDILKAYDMAIEALKKQERMKCKSCMFCHSGYCVKYDDLIPFGCFDGDWENWFCADWSEADK